MPRSRFGEVIEGPADRFGLDLDAGLSRAHGGRDRLQRRPAAARLHAGEALRERAKRKRPADASKAYDERRRRSAAIKHAADEILEETGYTIGLPGRRPAHARPAPRLLQPGAGGRGRSVHPADRPLVADAGLLRGDPEALRGPAAAGSDTPKTASRRSASRTRRCSASGTRSTAGSARTARRSPCAPRSRRRPPSGRPRTGRRAAPWPEERILDAVRRDRGERRFARRRRRTARRSSAFLGPTDPDEIATLPALDAAEDAHRGQRPLRRGVAPAALPRGAGEGGRAPRAARRPRARRRPQGHRARRERPAGHRLVPGATAAR